MTDPEQRMIEAINAARVERGLHALAANAQLAAAAERHAQDMATHPGIVHIGSDGSSIEERIRGAGYAPVAFGEVVAWGWQGEVAPALEWWLNSPGHVGYVLSPEYTEIGVGYATGLGPWGHYWAVDFGRPAAVTPPPPPRPYTSHVPVVVGFELTKQFTLNPAPESRIRTIVDCLIALARVARLTKRLNIINVGGSSFRYGHDMIGRQLNIIAPAT